MSIKRVNFTGRRRIARDRIEIVVNAARPRTFDAALTLDDLDFPPHSAVFIEATCAGSSAVQRFSFGEVGALHAPKNRTLDELDGERILFTVKVVDRSERHGRILGFAEQIRPRNAAASTDGGESILEVRVAELGQELWRMNFEAFPCLLLNRDVPGLKDRLRNDPLFAGAVLPTVVREVLRKVLRTLPKKMTPIAGAACGAGSANR